MMDRLLESEHGLLNSVERDGERSQRNIAAELGISLGLFNAHLKRCVDKGLVKVHNAPARRYVYHLTPQGFAEKLRLTGQYLSNSFRSFASLKAAKANGFDRLVQAGKSDLAGVAILCAVKAALKIVPVVDPRSDDAQLVGFDVVKSFADVQEKYDAVGVADVPAPICRLTRPSASSTCLGAALLRPPSKLESAA
jgi:DNA-binding MarR family transcriptional regulator